MPSRWLSTQRSQSQKRRWRREQEDVDDGGHCGQLSARGRERQQQSTLAKFKQPESDQEGILAASVVVPWLQECRARHARPRPDDVRRGFVETPGRIPRAPDSQQPHT